MKNYLRTRVVRVIAIAGLLLAVAGSVAYATIPDDGKVFHACMLNNLGTIRLIDPTLPSTNFMSKCSALESPVSWNQSGQQGIQGIQGPAGTAGADGKNGIDGKNGLDGKDGAPGTPGAAGKDGKDGLTGTNGLDGKDGARGNDGASCLTADGTQAVPSCVGPQGSKGDPGAQGPKGDVGPKGETGDPGPSDAYSTRGRPNSEVAGTETTIAELNLPAGAYVLNARVHFQSLLNISSVALCTLFSSDGNFLAGAESAVMEHSFDFASVTITGTVKRIASVTVSLRCQVAQGISLRTPLLPGHAFVNDIELTAVKVGELHQQ
jgi:hypothetical protein